MSDLRDKLARAIYENHYRPGDALWTDLNGHCRARYLQDADACLAVLEQEGWKPPKENA
jgi:hypothetical protein